MTFIETNRLILRNVAAKDAEIIYDYRNNETCARYQRGQTKDFDGIVEEYKKKYYSEKISQSYPEHALMANLSAQIPMFIKEAEEYMEIP